VPLAYFYYTTDANVTIDITKVFEYKVKASAAHTSQFEPSVDKYTPEMSEEAFNAVKGWMTKLSEEDGKMVEKFRRVEWP
jgi:LmbE family N-acetylglucosaminyl deacetylase